MASLQSGAALRDRMQRSGNLIVVGVLQVIDFKLNHGGTMFSSFRFAYKGRIYTIYLSVCPSGFTSKLVIEGLPTREYAGMIWKDQEQAKVYASNDAIKIIDAMYP